MRTTHANTARFYNESGRQSVYNPNCHRRRSSSPWIEDKCSLQEPKNIADQKYILSRLS